jgi:drug/metabolite transporter (DMT)-like permease
MLKWFSLLSAILAYTILSIGLVMMKRGIDWIGYKGPKDRTYRKNLFIWLSGFFFINLCIIPNTISLKHLDAHIVSAMAGWGVIIMVFLSSRVLKEKLYFTDFLGTVLIVGAIVLLNVFEIEETTDTTRILSYILVSVFPFLLLIPASLKSVPKKSRAILFAAVAGISTGMIVVTMNILVMTFGFHISSFFSSPIFYTYLLFSLSAFLTLQFAYKMGYMMVVGPVQYSLGIIYPVLCAFLVFNDKIQWVQIVSILVLVYGVYSILKKR